MPVDFSSLLADTLSNRGYEVEDASPIEGASGASYPVSMVAHREGEAFLVDALASRKVRDEDVQAVASIVDDAGLAGAIVLALKGDEHSTSAPGADRVEVWGRERVEQAVGALVVDRHLAANDAVDDIGPSPVDPYDAAEETPEPTSDPQAASGANQPTDPSPESGERAPAPANAASGPRPAQDTGPAEADGPSEPADDGSDAEILEPEPEPEPEPATAADEDPTPDLDDDVDHRDFVDPEDMLERAEQLMQQGGIDDGDAEIIVEDDEPAAEDPARAEAEPEAADAPSPSRPDLQEEPADDGSDAEILEPEPTPERPGPEGQAPEPETATTAREGDAGAEPPETDPDPDPPTPSGTSAPSPAAAAGPAHDDEAFVSGATIQPQIDETEARLTAEEALFEADEARLELLPFRVYRYEAELEGDGHTRDDEGRVWVSTQSGAVVRAPRGDRVDEPEVPHERFQDSLPRGKTEEAAREHLLDTLERREELRQDYSESAVIERVRLEPDPETLDVQLLGKAFAPRWRVEGSNGTVFVDAVTGELVNE